MRGEAPTCPFCDHAFPSSARPTRALLLVPVVAIALAATEARADVDVQDAGPVDDAVVEDAVVGDDDAAADAAEAAYGPDPDREVRPLYGAPPPPPRGCRSGCEVGADAAGAELAVVLSTSVVALIAGRRRRRDRS